MDILDFGNHILAFIVAGRWLVILPLIVPGSAYAHHVAKILDGVVPGQQVHYAKLFGFKRIYSSSPSVFL